MKLGANDVSAVKIGSTDVNKVYLGSNLVWEAGGGLLLDDYPNAAAAYSLRKLRNAYVGSAIEVRIDTTGQPSYDIGFDANGDLDTADLLSKAGSNDAFVSVWYDQSGAGIMGNGVQTNASDQPKIVENGVVTLYNSMPIVKFSNSLISFENLLSDSNERTIFALFNYLGASEQSVFNNGSVSNYRIQASINRQGANNIGLRSFAGGINTTTGNSLTQQQNLMSVIRPNLSTLNSYANSVLGATSYTSRGGAGQNTIGRLNTSYALNGGFSEYIIYNSNQSTNRTAIETNINTNYNIFWDGSQTGLLDDYPNAAAGYSLRALNSAYTGAAIKVRRSSDNAEQDISLLYDGSLNTVSLLSFVGAGDGFVSTWYDQSGAGNDVTQGSASAQPKIVSSGSVILENGKAAIEFDGSNDFFDATSVTTGNPKSIFISSKFSSVTASERVIFDSITTNQAILYKASNNSIALGFGTFTFTSYTATTDYVLYSIMHNGTNSNAYINSGQILTNQNLGTGSFNGLRIGAVRGTANLFYNGIISEFIVYGSDQSTDRADIETNINDYYTIY